MAKRWRFLLAVPIIVNSFLDWLSGLIQLTAEEQKDAGIELEYQNDVNDRF
jgi:hypothetical protein